MSAITIAPLRQQETLVAARMHLAELDYSFNSQIGVAHLAGIYRAMSARTDSYIGIASSDGVPVGVVSGTLNQDAAKKALLRALGLRGWLRLAGRLLLKPSAFFTLLEEMRPRPPVKAGGQEVKACLTAIAVAASHRRKGVASQLVAALEDFFRAHGVSHYWLDTVVENAGARSFYQKLGFTEVFRAGHTVVLLKSLAHHASQN